MDNFITEKVEYKCKQHERGCTWKGAINDYIRTVSWTKLLIFFLKK